MLLTLPFRLNLVMKNRACRQCQYLTFTLCYVCVTFTLAMETFGQSKNSITYFSEIWIGNKTDSSHRFKTLCYTYHNVHKYSLKWYKQWMQLITIKFKSTFYFYFYCFTFSRNKKYLMACLRVQMFFCHLRPW